MTALYRGILNATAITLFAAAWIAVWFNLAAFTVLMVASMGCVIGAGCVGYVQRGEWMRRGREEVWRRREIDERAFEDNDWRVQLYEGWRQR